MGKNADGKGPSPSRRDMLKLAAAASALAGGGTAQAQEAPAGKFAPRREALENLTAAEADTLEAFCARLIPTDANGPGAREARAAHYIDHALGGALASSRESYRSGLMRLDHHARLSKGASFAALAPDAQDAVLEEVEKKDAGFFSLVQQHTIQGTFCDPYYGGNADYVGWNMISYPGVRLSVSQADQAMTAHPAPERKSAYDSPMFGRGGAALADRTPAPADHSQMPKGMGNHDH
jgi:gluconate 2-dehydrogenase gamma chain